MTCVYNVVQIMYASGFKCFYKTATLGQRVKKNNDYVILTFNPMQSARHIY